MKAKPPSIPSLSPATAEDQNTHSANYDRMLYHRKPVEEATSLLRSSDHLLSSDDIRVLSGERPTLARTNSGKISPQVSISEEHIQESLSLWAKSEDVKMHGYVYRGSLNVRSICAKRYAVLKEGRLLLFKTAESWLVGMAPKAAYGLLPPCEVDSKVTQDEYWTRVRNSSRPSTRMSRRHRSNTSALLPRDGRYEAFSLFCFYVHGSQATSDTGPISEDSDRPFMFGCFDEIEAERWRDAIAGEAKHRTTDQGLAPIRVGAGHNWRPCYSLSRSWRLAETSHGIRILEEINDYGTGFRARMASTVIRMNPVRVFKAVMQIGSLATSSTLGNARHVENSGPCSDVLHLEMYPIPTHTLFQMSARDFVVERTWSQDEEGVFRVVFHSVENGKVPKQTGHNAPVRAEMLGASYTISPVNEAGAAAGHASENECLLTMVLRLDPKGLLSGNFASETIASHVRYTHAFLNPILLSVIGIRDEVEREKFVQQEQGQVSEGPLFTDEVTETPRVIVPEEVQPLSPMRSQGLLDKVARVGTKLKAYTSVIAGGTPTHAGAAEEAAAAGAKLATSAEQGPRPGCHILGRQFWSCPGASKFRVRGKNYLKDKIKVGTEAPILDLYAVELFNVKPGQKSKFGLAGRPESPINMGHAPPFTFVVNLMVPNAKGGLELLFYFGTKHDEPVPWENVNEDSEPWQQALAAYMDASDEGKSDCFKLIPSISDGSWIIKQSVGTTPVLIGRKLKCTYAKGPKYLEMDIDIGANHVANKITGMVVGTVTNLVVDLSFLIEARQDAHLPERLLGSVRMSHLDLKAGFDLPDSVGE